jgi:hypothetical protein
VKITITFPANATPTDVLAAEELLSKVLAGAGNILPFAGMLGVKLPPDAIDKLKTTLPSCAVRADTSR